MPLTTIAYLCLSGLAFVASVLIHPEWGLYGYLSTYNISPFQQWWGIFLPDFAKRYNMFFVIGMAAGMVFQYRKLKCPEVFSSQEGLLVFFIVVCWLSTLTGFSLDVDELQWKMLKIGTVLLMATRIITTRKRFEKTLLVLIAVGGYLGYALHSGAGGWVGGRFDRGFGGSDFAESNFLAAHFAWLLPSAGVRFLAGDKKMKALCAVSGALMVNAIVITRSRGTFLALALGAAATLWFLPRIRFYRKHIVVGLVVGLLGALSLTDRAFWERMSTLESDKVEEDASAQSRLEAWKVALRMWGDYPLGVGVGRYKDHAGHYNPNLAGRDTHNTYLRCLAETGAQGLLALLFLIVSSLRMLKKIEKQAATLEPRIGVFYALNAFALRISLIIYLTAALFISSVYIEEFYWLLMFPLFLMRALKNEKTSEEISQGTGGIRFFESVQGIR